ncbi:MAG: hypothetical protein CV087_11475 [Candidatus Brocadia sp. WS118]|nr:MAG: hypothetical protein CV087_11475 [Candidatus Brocadia sp. WS118]
MKNRKIVKSEDNYQINNFTKKECEVLNNRYFEFQVLCALRKNLRNVVELAQQDSILYARNTIYARKGM